MRCWVAKCLSHVSCYLTVPLALGKHCCLKAPQAPWNFLVVDHTCPPLVAVRPMLYDSSLIELCESLEAEPLLVVFFVWTDIRESCSSRGWSPKESDFTGWTAARSAESHRWVLLECVGSILNTHSGPDLARHTDSLAELALLLYVWLVRILFPTNFLLIAYLFIPCLKLVDCRICD